MKVDGVAGSRIDITGRDQQGLSNRITGRLVLDQNGQLLLKSHDGKIIPVRLMGVDLPLGQEMTFELVGQEGISLIYSAGTHGQDMSRFESLLQSWGIEPDTAWRDLLTFLYQEGLPLTKDNVLNLERSLRLIRQEWGLDIKPKILTMLMARKLPVRPQTLLAMLYRTTPEARQEIVKALGLPFAEIDTRTADSIEKSLQSLKEQVHSSDNPNIEQSWQAALGTVVCRTDDQGEIHWPNDDPSDHETPYAKRFGFDLIPPHVGLVEVDVEWAPEGSKVAMTVEPEYLEIFQKAIPKWQRALFEQGIYITASVKAIDKQSAGLPPSIDRRV